MNEDAPTLDLWWVIHGVLAGMSIPFLHPERLHTAAANPNAFTDDLPLLWEADIRAIVYLLNMPRAASTYAAADFAFHLLPLADGSAPSPGEFQQFLGFVTFQRARGHPVAVYCEAGIGRTGTLLAGYLIASGLGLETAIMQVRPARRRAIETKRQLRFLHDLHTATDFAAPTPQQNA